jgi:threonine dehydrogenase-like Zn-dependent dehydrogenase
MQALTVNDGELRFRSDYPLPKLAPGEALIRVILAGICSTDLEIVKGYGGGVQGVLGHEFVGMVESVADDADKEWVGRRVVGTINLGCRECQVCLSDGPEHCPNRTVLGIHGKDGVFADYVTLPVPNLLIVAEEVADDEAVFTEPLAAALRIRDQVRIRPSQRTAVVGPGRLGLLIGQVLALGGTDVTILGRRPETLELPAQLGLRTGMVGEQADNIYDLVVEATGNDAGFAHSLRIVRPQGTLVLKSTFHGDANIDMTKLVVGEIRVIGSRCGPFDAALRLLKASAGDQSTARAGIGIQVRPLVEGEYPLQDGLTALTNAARPGVRKILLRPN